MFRRDIYIYGLISATLQCVGLMEQYMAESASNYLKNPSKQSMVVLAGSAHIENRYGVPDRITRCLDSTHLLHTLTYTSVLITSGKG